MPNSWFDPMGTFIVYTAMHDERRNFQLRFMQQTFNGVSCQYLEPRGVEYNRTPTYLLKIRIIT